MVRLSVGVILEVSAAEPAFYTVTDFGNLSYTAVGEVTSLGEFGGTSNIVSHVPLQTGVVTKRKGSSDYGAMSIQMGRELSDAGQSILKDGFDGVNSHQIHSFKILSYDSLIYFTGVVSSYTFIKDASNSVSALGCVVELDGAVLESALSPASISAGFTDILRGRFSIERFGRVYPTGALPNPLRY